MQKIQDFWTPIFKLLIGYVQLIEFTVVLLWTIFVLSQDKLAKMEIWSFLTDFGIMMFQIWGNICIWAL